MRTRPRAAVRAALAAMLLWHASVLYAQGPRPQRGPQFRLPEPGTQLPDLTVYDEQGNPVALKNLRGSWTVLVFGCLT